MTPSTEEALELAKEMANLLAKEFSAQKIILFGSYAWGTPHLGSDIDLLVIVKESKERIIQRIQRARRVLRPFKVAKDVLVKTEAEYAFFIDVAASLESKINSKGIILYGK